MRWRYFLGGAGLLLLLLIGYPSIGNENTVIVIYTIGVALVLYGFLWSAPVPEPSPVIPPVKKSRAPVTSGPADNPWFPVFLIGGALIVLFIIGMIMIGIFIMAIENNSAASARAYESDYPEIMFINSDTGETRWLLREGDRVNISDTRYLLLSPAGFHEHRGRTWINITPASPLHVITTGFRDNAFWIETVQNEGENLRFAYSIDTGDRIPCSLPDSGNILVCSNARAGDPAPELQDNPDGGLSILINDIAVGQFGPPAVSDARGETRQMSYRIDPDSRTFSVSGDTEDLEYPLFWTLPI